MARTKGVKTNLSPRLTVQEARFVLSYITDGNGTRAAMETGWCPSGDKKAAANTGTYLLKKEHIASAIREQLDASAARTMITVDRIMQELYRGATYNAQHAFNADGSCKSIIELPEDLARALEGFEVEEVRGKPGTFITKYKFAKKAVAQQILLDRIDSVVKRFEVTGKDGAPLHSTSKVDLSDISKELLMRIVEQGDKS